MGAVRRWIALALALVAFWSLMAFLQEAQAAIATLPARVRGELVARGDRYVPLREISPWLIEAVVAAEDRSFWSNVGLSLEGILRALLVDIASESFVEGGSTITQQLARDQFLGPAKTLRRKLAEMAYAVLITRRYSKQEILELFLNQAYFGHGAWGVNAAAETYFALPPRDLSLPQAALLAGLLRAPTALDPLVHPQAARQRQQQVLDAMADVGYITPAEAKAAASAPLGLVPASPAPTGG